jgi:hypothetical protein
VRSTSVDVYEQKRRKNENYFMRRYNGPDTWFWSDTYKTHSWKVSKTCCILIRPHWSDLNIYYCENKVIGC